MNRYLWPLIGFAVLIAFLGAGLKLDPKRIPSPFIDKPAPAFSVPTLHQESNTISTADMRDKVWLLNVWASWCAACRVEHPLINALSQQGLLEIVGLNYKDERPAAKAWLRQFGDPYDEIAWDIKGDVGIDYGVYGVPESFLIDQQGIIRHKQIGPFDQETIQNTLIPMIKQLNAS